VNAITPSTESSHCNKRQSESGNKLAKTSYASSKDLDTIDWQQNSGHLETDVVECRGTWTSWGVITAVPAHHDDDDVSCALLVCIFMLID